MDLMIGFDPAASSLPRRAGSREKTTNEPFVIFAGIRVYQWNTGFSCGWRHSSCNRLTGVIPDYKEALY